MNYPIVQLIHGSRLYGLDGPQSDFDYKGIHLPSFESCFLLNACKHERIEEPATETQPKEEYESYALQEFLRLGSNGESIILDMLHSENRHIVDISGDLWYKLRANRGKFYTKNMVSSVGFAKSMALKYGFRAERKQALENVLDAIITGMSHGWKKMHEIWETLPKGEHIEYGTEPRNNHNDKRFIEVGGKKLQATIALDYAAEIMDSAVKRYGARVSAAADIDGNDMKAICHSFRVAYQLKHIYIDGGFTHPIPEASFVRDIKFGRVGYLQDGLGEKLDTLIAEVEELALKSSYPKRMDQDFIQDTVLEAYDDQVTINRKKP